MPKRYTSPAEIFAIGKLLAEHLVPTNDGLFIYADDWSDEKIARTVAPDLTAGHAATVRRSAFGLLQIKPDTKASALHADHERRITRLECQLRRLIDVVGCDATDRATIIGRDDDAH